MRAERLLSREDWDSLEQRVEVQGEAIRLMNRAIREIAREVDRRFDRLDRGGTFHPGVRY